MTSFSLECFQNEYLPEGASDVDAIVTITAEGAGPSAISKATGGAELIIIDISGSMHGAKLTEARRASIAAIDAISDGVRFGVIAGSQKADLVFPTSGLVEASAETRQAAAAAVRRLKVEGGTAIGAWVTLATDLLGPEAGVRHAILVTDGKDEGESPDALDAALDGAAGVFQCDCRGVGTDWNVAELRKVATALLGTVDIVAEPENLTADFQAMMRQAMGKSTADVMLRIWAPQGASLTFIKQVSPELQDMTPNRTELNALTGDYPTGSWGNESRDYHIAIRVKPAGIGDEMLAARVSVVVDGEVAGQALVRAIWTDDVAMSTRINRQVAHYTGQQELADAIQDGLEARKSGDGQTAAVKLGRAVQLAAESHNEDVAALLNKVVEVEDAATGKVRLKSSATAADEMTLDTRSTKTVRVRK